MTVTKVPKNFKLPEQNLIYRKRKCGIGASLKKAYRACWAIWDSGTQRKKYDNQIGQILDESSICTVEKTVEKTG